MSIDGRVRKVSQLACLLWFLGATGALWAQDGVVNSPGSTLRSDSQPAQAAARPAEPASSILDLKQRIENRIAQIEADGTLTPEQQAAIKQVHDQSLLNLTQLEQLQKEQQKWASLAETAPERLKQLQAELDDGVGETANLESLEVPDYDELRQQSQKLQAELVALDGSINELNREDARRQARRAELPELILSLKNAISESAKNSGEAADDSLLGEAQQWQAVTKQQVAQVQLASFESEQLAYEAEAPLLPLQAQKATRSRKRLTDRLKSLEQEMGRRRLGQIYAYQSKVQENPLGQEYVGIAEKLNRWLGIASEVEPAESEEVEGPPTNWVSQVRDHTSLRSEQERISALLTQWQDRKARIESRMGSDDARVSMSGFNSWVGLRLRKQRGELPSRDQQLIRLNALKAELQKYDAWLLEIEDVISQLRRGAPAAGQVGSPDEQPALSLKILQEMQRDVKAYIYDLYEVATTRQELHDFTTDYQSFIDKHILWIRSSEVFGQRDLKSLALTAAWLSDASKWGEVGSALVHDSSRRFLWYVFGFVALFLLLLNRGRILKRLEELSKVAARKTCIQYLPTVRAFLLSVFLAVPIPLLLLFLGWRIEIAVQNWRLGADALGLANAISTGCIWASAVLFPLEVIRQVCRSHGIAEDHFDWAEGNVRTIRRNLNWFVIVATPLALVTWAFTSQSTARLDSSLGRLSFMILMVALSGFFMRVCWPATGVFHQYISERQGGWTDRLRYIWYPALVIAPLVLAILSFSGFHYSARQLAGHLLVTLWILLILGIVYYLVKRWLLLSRRCLMMEQAKQRLELAAKGESSQTVAAESHDSAVDMVAINEQTKRLVASTVVTLGLVGLYVVWQDVLPAVGVLDRFELWEVAGVNPEESVSITLANLLLVIPIIILTVVATRNVPGLLEIALLQHLPITDAVRYAITTLARYAIVALGIMIASSMIGLQWSSIQWLVAALGVGLGFGLQEIFANFISGIILLFEQPIRVGDIITVGGTTGSVTKIRIRATTIVNWDRQELIIPNKDLITGTLLNWTLTDTTNRVVLNVGVAYGTNTSQACEIVRQVTSDHPEIMSDPAPNVTFEGFGDNTLNLVLRAYLATLDNRLGTINELHHQIYEALNEAGIELAFPQRDLHLKSIPDSLAAFLKS